MSTAAARRAPRIIFNSDGDIHFRGVQSPHDMDGFYRGIDELAGTRVDCYCYCISAGGDTYRHPSDVAPLRGADLETLDGVPDYLRRDIENTRALLAAGIDPLVLLPRRARGHGMEFWASMRMNDIHDDYPECAAYHGGFRKAHPELLLGSSYPEPKHRGNWRAGFCWGLDYARPEVRGRQLALIEEVLTRYDVDGFELDFLRGAYYFRTDERDSAMPLMTDFVRGVRRLVDRAGEGKGGRSRWPSGWDVTSKSAGDPVWTSGRGPSRGWRTCSFRCGLGAWIPRRTWPAWWPWRGRPTPRERASPADWSGRCKATASCRTTTPACGAMRLWRFCARVP